MRSLSRILKTRSQNTARKHLEKHPDLVELFNQKQNELLDFAEDVLLQNLTSNNDLVRARTCEFILKNLPNSKFVDADKQDENVQLQLVKLIDRMIENSD